MRSKVIASLVIVSLSSHSFSLTGPGVAGSPLLGQTVGARPLALGTSYVALADDSFAGLWNPGGLAFLRTTELSLTYQREPGEVDYSYVLFATPVFLGQRVSAGVGTLQTGDIEFVDLSGNPQTVAGQQDWLVTASYGLNLSQFLSKMGPRNIGVGAGITANYLRTSIASSFSDNVPAVNIGAMAAIPVMQGQPAMRVGVVWKSIGTTTDLGTESDPVLSPIRLGIAQSVIESSNTWTTASIDVEKVVTRKEIRVFVGGEQALKTRGAIGVALRAGYRIGVDLPGVTAGLGAKWTRFVFDYGMSQVGELGLIHRVSLRMRFR